MIGHDPQLKDLERHIGKYYGKYAGIVVDNKDKETDESTAYGKIKVKVPSILPEDQSVWARPCFPFAHFFVPNVGSWVWVEFEGGDLRYPIWSGSWYPKDKKPKKSNTSDNDPTNRMMRTPSGHEVELDDTGGKEKIKINHKIGDGTDGERYVEIDNDKIMIQYKEAGNIEISKKDGKIEVNLDATNGGAHKHTHYNKTGIEVLSSGGGDVISVSVTGGKCNITAQEITISAIKSITLQAGMKIDVQAPKISMMGLSIDLAGGKISLAAPQISMG